MSDPLIERANWPSERRLSSKPRALANSEPEGALGGRQPTTVAWQMFECHRLERLGVLIANDFMSRMGGWHDDAHTSSK
jgi:hypothetical protein